MRSWYRPKLEIVLERGLERDALTVPFFSGHWNSFTAPASGLIRSPAAVELLPVILLLRRISKIMEASPPLSGIRFDLPASTNACPRQKWVDAKAAGMITDNNICYEGSPHETVSGGFPYGGIFRVRAFPFRFCISGSRHREHDPAGCHCRSCNHRHLLAQSAHIHQKKTL